MMMTTAGAIDPRIPWPPEEARERLEQYEMYRGLYEGDHREVFVDSKRFHFQADADKPYLFCNLLGALTDLLTGRLLGEEVGVGTGEGQEGSEEFIKHLRAQSEAAMLDLEAAKTASICGDSWLKVRYDAGLREILYDSVDPACVFPEFDPLNRRLMVAADIGQVLCHGEDKYLWIERHEAGRITNRLWRLHDEHSRGLLYDPMKDEVDLKTLDATAALQPEQPTGVDAMLLVHVPNELSVDDPFWGASDYEDLAELNGGVNAALTDRREVIRKHVAPVMTGPPIGEDALTGGKVDLKKVKYIEQDNQMGAAVSPSYLVWDANLEAVVAELDDLKRNFAIAAGIELAALVPQDGGGPESGRALRLSQMRTQGTVRLKQRPFGGGLRQVYSLCTRLATATGVSIVLDFKPTNGQIVPCKPTDITIDFGDGLPSDSWGDTEEQVALVDARLQSRVDAIKTLFDLTDDEARAKLADIEADNPAQTSPVSYPSRLGGQSSFAAALGIGATAIQQPQEQQAAGV